MLYVAWMLSVIVSFYLGYHFRILTQKIELIEEAVKTKVDKKVETETVSEVIDPLDPVQNAIYEHNKMMEELNGKDS